MFAEKMFVEQWLGDGLSRSLQSQSLSRQPSNVVEHNRNTPESFDLLVEAAAAVGVESIAARLMTIAEYTDTLRVPQALTSPPYPQNVVAARSYRLAASLRIRAVIRRPIFGRIARKTVHRKSTSKS